MFSLSDTRKSWQKATKFREHLSFIKTGTTTGPNQVPPNTKSAWSPVTPSIADYEPFEPSSPPPVPPMPAIHATHTRLQEQELDEKRSIERARAEAAAALEKGSKERQADRERLDRQRQRRLLQEREHAYQASRQKQEEAAHEEEDSDVEGVDIERGRGASDRQYLNSPRTPPPDSFISRSKAAFARASRAVFRFTSTPAPEESSPYPRDTLPSHLRRDSAPRQSRFGLKFPARLSELSPWPALNVLERHNGSESGAVVRHHYYGDGASGGSEPRVASFAEEPEHTHRNASSGEKEKGEKLKRCPVCHSDKKRRKRNGRCWCILLLILILLLAGNIVFLNVHVFNKGNSVATSTNTVIINGTTTNTIIGATSTAAGSSTKQSSGSVTATTTTTTASSSASATSSVSAAVTSCISAFASVATPSQYQCSECVPILAAIPNDLSPSLTSTPPVEGQGNILQFCALKAVNDGLPAADSNVLTNVGWLGDTRPCAWQGVSCDGNGRFKTLELVTPGVPTSLPQELQFLVALQSLQITGDNNLPSGSLGPILTLPTLTSLNLLQTALTGSLDDQNTLSSLPSLTSLSLNKNAAISLSGVTMGGIINLPLTSLLLNGQTIPNNVLSLLSSTVAAAPSLTSLDLSNTNQTGAIPSGLSGAMPNLVELILDGNTYTSLPDPSTNDGVIFPPKIQVVSIRANAAMAGTMAAGECSALQTATVSRCDFTGTNIVLAGGASCGICQFGPTSSS